jgi:hypothetical protein
VLPLAGLLSTAIEASFKEMDSLLNPTMPRGMGLDILADFAHIS